MFRLADLRIGVAGCEHAMHRIGIRCILCAAEVTGLSNVRCISPLLSVM